MIQHAPESGAVDDLQQPRVRRVLQPPGALLLVDGAGPAGDAGVRRVKAQDAGGVAAEGESVVAGKFPGLSTMLDPHGHRGSPSVPHWAALPNAETRHRDSLSPILWPTSRRRDGGIVVDGRADGAGQP